MLLPNVMHNAVFTVHLLSSQFRSARSCRCVCLFFGVCGFMCLLLFICLFCVVFVFQYEHPCLPTFLVPLSLQSCQSLLSCIRSQPSLCFLLACSFIAKEEITRNSGNKYNICARVSITRVSCSQFGKLLHHLTSLAWNVCRDGDLL